MWWLVILPDIREVLALNVDLVAGLSMLSAVCCGKDLTYTWLWLMLLHPASKLNFRQNCT
jgi:hypothetical protein